MTGSRLDEGARWKRVMDKAVVPGRKGFIMQNAGELQEDLQEMLDLLYGVQRGEEPSGNIGASFPPGNMRRI